MTFRKKDVTVTLTGEQWFALMAKLAGKTLSNEGRGILRAAMDAMGKQVVAQSDCAC